ncbi:hypothetical protein EIP91_007339 [Steccherinum ochraceum]|uniref:F-box domain-containing protein n=1 Tax=Steccherinum ochraceum TaxID=92696 RepID=A0A4R0RWG4_9APHY|nr:hypothetical protein EIP91_007339 [Steccherinum ochraceum]
MHYRLFAGFRRLGWHFAEPSSRDAGKSVSLMPSSNDPVPSNSIVSSLVLPWDILLYTMSFLRDQRSIIRMMHTCRTLFNHGLPLLVEDCFLAEEIIPFFTRFMLNHPECSSLVRRMEIAKISTKESYVGEDERTRFLIGQLPDVIRSMTNLQKLRCHDLDDFLELNSKLIGAFASLATIKVIQFNNLGILGQMLLTKLSSPVEKAVLDFNVADGDWTVEFSPETLKNFAGSLQELYMTYPPSDAFKHHSTIQWQYPRVHSLHLDLLCLNLTPYQLASIFPGLRFLEFRYSDARQVRDSQRQQNEQDQRITWTSLDKLSCDVCWAYELAFKCTVRYWCNAYIGDAASTSSSQPQPPMRTLIEYFQAVIGDIRPLHLDVLIRLSTIKKEGLVGDIFPPSGITHLHVDLCDPASATVDVSDRDLSKVMDNMIVNFERSPLQLLSIRIRADNVVRHWPFILPQTAVYALGVTYITRWDAEAYAERLAQRLPHLQHLCIQFAQKEQPDGFWSVSREGAGKMVSLKKLTQEEGVKVLHASPFAGKIGEPQDDYDYGD